MNILPCAEGWDVMRGPQLKPNLKDNVKVKIVDKQPYFDLYQLIQFASSNECNGQHEWVKLPLSVRFKFAGATSLFQRFGRTILCIDLQGALTLIRTLPMETTEEHREQAYAFICKYFEYSPPEVTIEAKPEHTIEAPKIECDNAALERRLNLIRRAYDDYSEYASGVVPAQDRAKFTSLLLHALALVDKLQMS